MTRQLIVTGRYDRIHDVCRFVASGAEEVGFDPDEVFRIELACDEACTNVIQHAYGGENVGNIVTTWEFEAGAFKITIDDNGRPFNPQDVPEPSVPADAKDIDDLKIGGLGIHLMNKLMDEVDFSFNDASGNRVVMIKILSDRKVA